MSAASEWGKLAIGLAADVVGGLIEAGELKKAQKAEAERVALAKLLAREDPKQLASAYAAAKAKGPKR